MADPQQKPGESILEGLRSSLGVQVEVPSEPSAQRRRRGPFTDGRDILAGIQAAQPSAASQFVSSVVDGVVSLGVYTKDSAVNLLKDAGTITLMASLEGCMLLNLVAWLLTANPIPNVPVAVVAFAIAMTSFPNQSQLDDL